MSTKNHHVILRSRIEVTIDQHSQNSTLQHTIYKTIQKRIMPILSKLFSQHVPNDVVIHLDKLVLDGGSFNLSNLSKQLPHRIEQILVAKLKEQLGKVVHNPALVIPLPDAKRQAIMHYLSEGHFAWWMVERSEKQIEKIYLELLHDTPLLIEQLWWNLNKKENAVQRCMALFSRTTVEHTLACLLKQPIAYFKPILGEIGLLLHQTKILTNPLYTKEVLSMALLGTINQQGHKVDRMGFCRMLLKQVALQTATSYENTLEKLYAYYAQNDGKSSLDQTTKTLVFQLRDLVVTPPKFWYQDVKSQENVLKELDKIGNNTLPFYQLSTAMSGIKAAMGQSTIRPLVKSWLQEAKNRETLAKNLPDMIFFTFLKAIDPSIVSIFSDFMQLITAATATVAPACAIKTVTLAYCAFEHSKTLYLQEVQSLFRKYLTNNTINKQHFTTLFTTQPYTPTIKSIMVPLVSTFASDAPQIRQDSITHEPIKQPIIENSLAQPIPLSTELLDRAASLASVAPSNRIDQGAIAKDYAGAELVEPLPTKQYTSYLDRDPKNLLSDVVNFLVYNELPPDQPVPAYLIAKSLRRATPKQIRDHLAPLCQEATILKKLIQHATEVVLSKLFQAFIPYPSQMLYELEKVILQALQPTHQQINTRLIKEVFITAAINHTPSEKKYIARILLHLSAQTASPPAILCDQLIAKQSTHAHLVEAFALLKEKLAPLNLNKIDEEDLVFLSTNKILDKAPLYYSKLWLAIKDMARQSIDLSQSAIDQLVAQELPTIAKPLQKKISIALYKQITNAIQSKTKRVVERWNLFLHTGKLGNYSDETALLNDVISHLPTFALAQDKTHVRQRLIANFTHPQLMLLVRKQSDVGKTLAPFIQGCYQLWCATQGAVGEQNITKNLFWDSVLKTLPQSSISKDDWLAQITTELSNVLEITSTTLLETFQLLDLKGIPEGLTLSLHKLQEKYCQRIYQQAIQRGYKEPILTKLYLLLNGNVSFVAKQYHLAIDRLGDELVEFMKAQPAALSKLLEEQANHQVVARRMVHYFNQTVTTKMITTLASGNASFVMHYLDLLSNPVHYATTPLPLTWQKELYIATIYNLITQKPFEERAFVHRTLLATGYSPEVIYKIITSIVATKATDQKEDKMIALLKPLIKRINNPSISQSALIDPPLEEMPAPIQKRSSQKSSLPEEVVRVYTKNTGLVFLWPFFYDFFKAHNLMVGNQFLSDQAAHNAVYLLQYLVTGKLKSPEWQLTLPKLLCGLSYDAVLLPYSAIDSGCDAYGQEEMEAEAESEQQPQPASKSEIETETGASLSSSAMEAITANSHLLIEKVIERWKSLTKLQEIDQNATTQHILQSYFLNRLGILTRHEAGDENENTFWHLTVMHQDHDRGDLLPPWFMNNVKLPWMQEEIILFWIPE